MICEEAKEKYPKEFIKENKYFRRGICPHCGNNKKVTEGFVWYKCRACGYKVNMGATEHKECNRSICEICDERDL